MLVDMKISPFSWFTPYHKTTIHKISVGHVHTASRYIVIGSQYVIK